MAGDGGRLAARLELDNERFLVANKESIDAINKSEESFKQFFYQQRTGDRINRESASGMMLLANAISITGGGTQTFNTAMNASVQGMQAAEFAGFALSRSLSAVRLSYSALIGPISVIVAVGAALLTFLHQQNKETEDLKKQLGDLKLDNAPDAVKRQVLDTQQKDTEEQIHRIEEARKRVAAVAPMLPYGGKTLLDVILGTSDEDLLKLQVKLENIKKLIRGTEQPFVDHTQEGIAEAKGDREREAKEAKKKREQDYDEVQKYVSDRYRQEKEDELKQEEDFMNWRKQAEEKFNQLKIEAAGDEVDQVRMKYQVEEEELRKNFEYADGLDEALTNLHKSRDREVAAAQKQLEQQEQQRERQAFSQIRGIAGDITTILGATGADWVSDLEKGLSIMQAMLDIAMILKAIQVAAAIPTGGGSILSGLASGGDLTKLGSGGILGIEITVNDSRFAKALRAELRNDPKLRLGR